MKKILIGLFVLFFCLIAIVMVGRNFIIKKVIVKGVEALAGVPVEIEKVNMGFNHTFEINSLKIFNPDGFPGAMMIEIPRVFVDYDLGGFFGNRVHLNKIAIEVQELLVVLNEQGKLNLNALTLLMPKPGTGKSPEVKIDEFSVKIGKVGYKSFFAPLGKKTMEFHPDIEETFKDVTNPSALSGQILKKILSRIGITKFAAFDISEQVNQTQQAVTQALDASAKAVQSSVKEIETSAKASLDKTKKDLQGIFSQEGK